ncbi:alpha/beta fold hydrolase [Helicobacter cholecystus]|uniref:alpha/beta fold hydrolase n=1 Tax=Helicobacter cholecystus TaxID=45498 RepID=UPI002739090C|nr:alpha/beta fold hydrolase [Helicobacter cholecystus]
MRKNLKFKSDFGEIAYLLYECENPNGFIVQIAHGMIEEKSKYEELALALCQSGYIVAINDHRGHGESIGGKSGKHEVVWGEMGENGFERAVEDMHTLTLILKDRFKGYSLFLLGHSMGSLLSRVYLQKYENELSGLILMGTPSPNSLAGVGMILCDMLNFFGMKSLGSKGMNFATLISFNQKFIKENRHNPSYAWLTRELKNAEGFKSRADYQFSFTLNSFKNLFSGLRQVFSPYPNVQNPFLPIMFMSGDDDPCGEFGKGVFKAYKHLTSQGYCNVELRMYSGARHELLLESNKRVVIEEIVEFFNRLKEK